MSDLVVPNIFCLQTQKQPPTLNNIRVLLKGHLIDYVHVISCTQKPLCVHVACTLFTVRAICRALYTIQHVTTGNPASSYLFFAVDKTDHGPVIALFSIKLLQFIQLRWGCHKNQHF